MEISDGLKRRAISAAATDGGCGGSTEEEEEEEENISVTDIAFRGCRADRRVFSRGIHILRSSCGARSPPVDAELDLAALFCGHRTVEK